MIEFKQINDMFCIAKNIKMNKEIKWNHDTSLVTGVILKDKAMINRNIYPQFIMSSTFYIISFPFIRLILIDGSILAMSYLYTMALYSFRNDINT